MGVPAQGEETDRNLRCSKCARRGHMALGCTTGLSKIRCYKCNGVGHVSLNCKVAPSVDGKTTNQGQQVASKVIWPCDAEGFLADGRTLDHLPGWLMCNLGKNARCFVVGWCSPGKWRAGGGGGDDLLVMVLLVMMVPRWVVTLWWGWWWWWWWL